MNWDRVVGYRMRFDAETEKGDIRVEHVNGGKRHTTTLESLSAGSFAAIAMILTNEKQKVLFNGEIFDSGPQKL